MSRPPRFRTRYSTTGDPMPGQRTLDYLGSEFADSVERQRALASEELGFPPSTAEGDFAGTLMELSALVAHVLGVYQDRFAGEAFIGTAQSQKSLVRHGRRLGYEPSPGLSATGHVVFTAKDGLLGTIAKGFALTSAPVGEKKAQDYETLDDLDVDAGHNEMLPDASTEPVPLTGATTFQIAGVGHRIEAGEHVVVKVGSGGFLTTSVKVSAHEVTAVSEDEAADATTLTVKQALPMGVSFEGATLLAKPDTHTHLFAWDTSPNDFSEAALKGGAYPGDPAVGGTAVGYVVSPAHDSHDLYLAVELGKSALGKPVIRLIGSAPTAFKVSSEGAVSAMFKRVGHIQFQDGATPPNVQHIYPTVSTSRAVTAIRVQTNAGTVQLRSGQEIRTSQWLLDFAIEVPLVTSRPSSAALTLPLTLDRAVAGLAPGQLVALSTLEGASPAVTEIARLTFVDELAGLTRVSFALVDPPSAGRAWTLGELRVLGNVVGVSHGKAISEVLGDSDGVTPFLRFSLKQKPLTHLPGVGGAEPALEIRIADVLWTRVVDFEESTTHDRHYLVQRDEAGTTSVVFGDGQKGAVPAAGKKHIVATYRVGVGRVGDAGAGAVRNIKKSHPILDEAVNPRPVFGGADPVGLEDVRAQATTYLRTFDRAVSVEDHKHLALRFPGVVKANAAWTELFGAGVEGVKVVVADAAGDAPAIPAITAFLQARRDDTVPLEIVSATRVDLYLRMQLDVDPAFEPELVRRAVRAALTSEADGGLFTFAGRDLGQPAFLSQVYERVVAIEGVRFALVWHFDTLAEVAAMTPVRVVDTVAIRPDEWLALDPMNLDFAPASEVSP